MCGKNTLLQSPYGNRVRVRVMGLCFRDEALLMVQHRLGEELVWLPPGGEVQCQEGMREGLVREFEEEVHLPITVEQCVGVYEFRAAPLHAVEFFFIVQAPEHADIVLGHDPETAVNPLVSYAWLSLSELQAFPKKQVHAFFWGINTQIDLLKRDIVWGCE